MPTIRELFEYDVTRVIPPVVYFHEQSPEQLEAEVREYIITGGDEPDRRDHAQAEPGIHEHYVKLLRGIVGGLDAPDGPGLPAAWISGFYGSGKSSFAKLLGLSLDGATLPDESPLATAWLARDRSARAAELREAWAALTSRVDPMAVVFDIGGVSRGAEHIHAAVVRQVQARLGYCSSSALVASDELELERDGHYDEFLRVAEQTLGKPWAELGSTRMVEDRFSAVLHALFPSIYRDPLDWISAHAGRAAPALSAEDAARAIADMLDNRAPGKTLFVVVDEVSQYIAQDQQRMLALQSLVSALAGLRGRVWLLATGQHRLDARADGVLDKLKDRFPESLRVHLDATSIRDVVHRRLLQKREDQLPRLRELYAEHRSNLSLFAYGCDDIHEADFVEVYPLLPQQVDLILRIATVLRARSPQSARDHQAIRGLLQLLGELFRTQREALTEAELGALISLDRIYDVQAAGLDVDTRASMARIFEFCSTGQHELAARCAKVVALLELLQSDESREPSDSKRIARCLYAHLGQGDNEPAVRAALEQLRDANLLGYSEKLGYMLQSADAQEWEREREDIGVPSKDLVELVADALRSLVDATKRPQLGARAFAWAGLLSAGGPEHVVFRGRDDAAVVVDFRVLASDARAPTVWVNRSAEADLADRIVWIAGAHESVLDKARTLARSKRMVARHQPKRASLSERRRRLLDHEQARRDALLDELVDRVGDAFMRGRMYFGGSDSDPNDYGPGFVDALAKAGQSRLPSIYKHFVATHVSNAELEQLLARELSGPSTKFYADGLGILAMDGGRTIPECGGTVPRRILELVERDRSVAGEDLLRQFGRPPYGYAANVVKACVAGLLRAAKLRLRLRDGSEVGSVVDPGVWDLFGKDREFKAAELLPAGRPTIKAKHRFKIAELFETVFATRIPAENDAIADALGRVIVAKQAELRELEGRLAQLPGPPPTPAVLSKLHRVFADCLRPRGVEARVLALVEHLASLRDGVTRLDAWLAQLDDEAIDDVRTAKAVADTQLRQLLDVGRADAALLAIERRIAAQLESETPWLGIDALADDLEVVRVAYREERLARVHEREQLAEAARARIKQIFGFETLDATQRHAVLRPISEALDETREAATEPCLRALLDGLGARLDAALAGASERIDELARARGERIVHVELDVRDRVIASVEDVDRLLDEVRARLLAELDADDPELRLRLR